MTTEAVWIAVGLGGQACFFSRFLVQWIASEKARRSVIPTVFWYLSLGGSAVLLAYALHRKDLVFTLGQTVGFFIYVRNLWLIYAHRAAQPPSPNGSPAD